MTRFIRWQGAVAFISLAVLITVFIYFFAETLVKSAIVKSAESAFGAEVNVTDVKLGYSPFKVSIIELQVTDKENPTHNVFSFERATAAVDVWQYIFGKVIIDQLEVSELALGSTRIKAGKVYDNKDAGKSAKEESLSSKAKAMLPEVDMQLPDVKTLLNDSNLLTVKASEALKASYKAEQEKLTALKGNLPNKDKVQYYKNKVKELSKIDVKTLEDVERIATEYETLKAEFKADQALIKQAKNQVITSKALLVKQSKALKNAPTKDWQTIEKKYQLESIETEDFAHILFGEQARGYFQKAMWAYEVLVPFMDGSKSTAEAEQIKTYAKGRFVYFEEEIPLPSLLIKQALFSMTLEQSDFIIEASELTHQHWLRGKESTIAVSSTSNGELAFDTRFKISKSGKFVADGNWSVVKRRLSGSQLTKSKALTLAIDKALMSGEGSFTLVDTALLSDNSFSLTETTYQGNASTKLTNLLLDTVQSLDQLALGVSVKGQLEQPDFSISSSLNQALSGAFKKQISKKADEFKSEVYAGLNDKLSESLRLGDAQYNELLDFEMLLTDTDNALENLKNSDVVQQQKDKLKDKLKNKAKEKVKDKLKGKLGDLFG